MKILKNRIRILSVVLAAAMSMTSIGASANGFYIQEMTAPGLGQAGAMVAAGQGPANQYWNAANLAYSKGFWFEAGLTTFIPISWYRNDVTGVKTYASDAPQPVPAVFASYRINDWLTVGIAEFTNFGLAINWPQDWEGNHKIISSSMQTFTINPNIAFGPFKGFSIGVGFDAMYGNFKIKKALTLGLDDRPGNPLNLINLSGEAWGFGANIGLMYQPVKWVRIGASYRTAIKIAADSGYVDFDVSEPWAARFKDQRFSAEINLPHIVFLGVRFFPIKGFSIELDAQWIQWSTWDTLKFKLSEGIALGPTGRQNELSEVSKYHDAWQVRIGGEYKFFKNHFAVRAGFLWDQNPASAQYLSPMLPDSNRVMPCISFGTEWAGFFIDVAYMPVFTLQRTVTWEGDGNNFPGTYKNITHDLTVSLGYHFDVVKGKARIPKYSDRDDDDIAATSDRGQPDDVAWDQEQAEPAVQQDQMEPETQPAVNDEEKFQPEPSTVE